MTLWVQIGVPLSEEEESELQKLTPGQRRFRLLFADEGAVRERAALESLEGDVERKQQNYRVLLQDTEERLAMLRLTTAERRWRLLTPPLGGEDPPDMRRGVWDRSKFLRSQEEQSQQDQQDEREAHDEGSVDQPQPGSN